LVAALAGPGRTLRPAEIEVAMLRRDAPRRSFHRVQDDELTELLAAGDTSATPAS